MARLLAAIQLSIAPERIVLGGGIGLAPGMIARLRAEIDGLPALRRPDLAPAALGPRAGLAGAADLARPGTDDSEHLGRRPA